MRCASDYGHRSFASVVASLCYNFFFLPPVYTFTISRSDECRGIRSSSSLWRLSSPLCGARAAHRLSWRIGARTTHRVAVRSSAASSPARLRSTTCSGRPRYQTALMLKVRVSCVCSPGERVDRREGRLPAGGHARASGLGGRQVDMGERSPRGSRFRYASRRQAAVSADAHRPRCDRSVGDRQRQARAAADARSATTARCVDRPGRARHRASAPGAKTWTRAKRYGRGRSAAFALLTSISHDLKTPLAGVLGAAESAGGQLSACEQAGEGRRSSPRSSGKLSG